MPTNPRLKARPARIRVERQLTDDNRPKTQAPHTQIHTRLLEVWQEHFEGHGRDSAGIELGMQLILYLTGNPHITAHTLASRLCSTYPEMCETLASNARVLSDALSDGH